MQREISGRVAVLCLGQAFLFIAAMMLCTLARAGWETVVCIGLLACAAIAVGVTGSGAKLALGCGWLASVAAWLCSAAAVEGMYHLKWDHLTVAGSAMAGVWLASRRVEMPAGLGGSKWQAGGAKGSWRLLALSWALVGSGAVLADGYLRNRLPEWVWGGMTLFAFLIIARLTVRLPGAAIQLVHTILLFTIGLPVADALTRPTYQLDTDPEKGRHYYSFEAAKKNPGAFASWWNHFVGQWLALHEMIAFDDPNDNLRYKLRPGSEGQIFDSHIQINSLGFRGPEIEVDKGEAYRIIALGESTTFGCTIREDGQPWPRVLEGLLNERLDLDRPVQVINGGVYGFTIEENVRRLKGKILPLDPDMIISYHGYNFFSSLHEALPPVRGESPPAYHQRPLKLLADLEYQLQVRLYQWRRGGEAGKPSGEEPVPGNPMETLYADAYRELIRTTQEHGVRLVLANYCMAVNRESRAEVVEFYRAGFPEVLESIEANEWHSEIVARLVEKHPKVIGVDTHPRLDGKYEKYIDLMHFTQEGREILAETFFHAIRGVVAKEAGGTTKEPSVEGRSGKEKSDQVVAAG